MTQPCSPFSSAGAGRAEAVRCWTQLVTGVSNFSLTSKAYLQLAGIIQILKGRQIRVKLLSYNNFTAPHPLPSERCGRGRSELGRWRPGRCYDSSTYTGQLPSTRCAISYNLLTTTGTFLLKTGLQRPAIAGGETPPLLQFYFLGRPLGPAWHHSSSHSRGSGKHQNL